jgi:uncharacterized protein YjaG (DUF416 family)
MASTKIFKQLAKLTGWRQKVYLLALAERSLPHIMLYGDIHDRPKQAKQVKHMLDVLWQSVSQRQPKVWLQKSVDENGIPAGAGQTLDEWVGFLQQDESFGSVAAAHSIKLVEGALLAFQKQRLHQAAEMGQLSFNFVTEFVEMQEGEGLDDEALVALFNESLWCQQELKWQREMYTALDNHKGAPEPEWLAQIRLQAANEGVSGIGISVDEQ